MNFVPGPDRVVRISFEIADLKTWVQIPVGALDLILVLIFYGIGFTNYYNRKYVSLDSFLTQWSKAEKKNLILQELEGQGLLLDLHSTKRNETLNQDTINMITSSACDSGCVNSVHQRKDIPIFFFKRNNAFIIHTLNCHYLIFARSTV
jgi:hypothetical protein